MKKTILAFTMTLLILFGGLNMAFAQEQPNPKKDTVNMDTKAKPTFYYPVEDEKKVKNSASTIGLIIGAIVIIGGVAFFLLKKKK